MDAAGIGRVAANTTLAARARGNDPPFSFSTSGSKNGTPAASPMDSSPVLSPSPVPATGSARLALSPLAIAGIIVILGVDLLEDTCRIDDPIGAVPVHGICGIWGTLSLGFFACGKYAAGGSAPDITPDTSTVLTGLFYPGGTWRVLAAQFIGSAIITSTTLVVSLIVMYAVNLTGTLRISPEAELDGLDLHEHGISAYPEYVISALSAPRGITKRDPVDSLPPSPTSKK